jgi:hypothetical protein
MKKRFLGFLAIALTALAVTSCGLFNPLKGTWVADVNLVIATSTITLEISDTTWKSTTVTTIGTTASTNTASGTYTSNEEAGTITMTTTTRDNVAVTEDPDTTKYSIKDNKLTLSIEGIELVFTKQ